MFDSDDKDAPFYTEQEVETMCEEWLAHRDLSQSELDCLINMQATIDINKNLQNLLLQNLIECRFDESINDWVYKQTDLGQAVVAPFVKKETLN